MSWSPVRYIDGEFSLRCTGCAEKHGLGGRYWPLTPEFWNPVRGMSRCRACWHERDSRHARAYRERHLERVREIKRRYARETADVAALKRRWRRNRVLRQASA